MQDKASTDVIVIGAGHNGLVCAAYLAKAGLSVRSSKPAIASAARR
jgi:ribulose 1,5-bisphosphate synthetase/thiazole synthase